MHSSRPTRSTYVAAFTAFLHGAPQAKRTAQPRRFIVADASASSQARPVTPPVPVARPAPATRRVLVQA